MSKVIFIIVKSYFESNWLNNKLLQLTNAFISVTNHHDTYPIFIVDSYNDLNFYLDKADLLIVSTAGTIIVDSDHIWDKIHSFDYTIGLMGHIVNYDIDTELGLHKQFFIINTKAYKNLNFEENTYERYELNRSEEDVHGGWAPLFATLGNKIVKKKDIFGTKLIYDCLISGYKSYNFDMDWRYPEKRSLYYQDTDELLFKEIPTRFYLYPENNTKNLEKALKEFKLNDGLIEQGQRIFIKLMLPFKDMKLLNVWHWDTINSKLPKKDIVICTANGFQAEMFAVNSECKKILFYDFNIYNIEFKKDLYQNWDGNNYEEFAYNWAKKNNCRVEPIRVSDQKTSNIHLDFINSNILNDWKKWKSSVKVDFIHCDVISSINTILDNIVENSLLSTSTILNIYPISALFHDIEEINITRSLIQNKIQESNSIWIE